MIKKITLAAAFALMASGCQNTAQVSNDQIELLGTWQVEQLNGQAVVDQSQASLIFGSDGQLNGNSSCNSYFGSYSANGTELSLTPAGMTRKACLEALMMQETQLMETMPKVSQLKADAGKLLLQDKAGNTLMVISRI